MRVQVDGRRAATRNTRSLWLRVGTALAPAFPPFRSATGPAAHQRVRRRREARARPSIAASLHAKVHRRRPRLHPRWSPESAPTEPKPSSGKGETLSGFMLAAKRRKIAATRAMTVPVLLALLDGNNRRIGRNIRLRRPCPHEAPANPFPNGLRAGLLRSGVGRQPVTPPPPTRHGREGGRHTAAAPMRRVTEAHSQRSKRSVTSGVLSIDCASHWSHGEHHSLARRRQGYRG